MMDNIVVETGNRVDLEGDPFFALRWIAIGKKLYAQELLSPHKLSDEEIEKFRISPYKKENLTLQSVHYEDIKL